MNSYILPLLNGYEKLTFKEIKKVTDEIGVSVYPKVRIADVLKIKDSGLSNDEYSYSLKAHFDFVICNSDDSPEFSVEFDGPMHIKNKQKKMMPLKIKSANSLIIRYYVLIQIT